jgi:CBS domain-containing protein
MSEATQPLPVRTHLTVLRDGTTTSSFTVFCEAQTRSVELARCATCGFGGALANDPRGYVATVACSRFSLPTIPPPPESSVALRSRHAGGFTEMAATLAVGLVLTRSTTSIRYDVPIEIAQRVLATAPSAYGLPVVDEAGRFIGLLARAAAALTLTDPDRDGATVAGRMVSPTCAVDERTSLDVAFATMASHHARELTVVADDREVVGTLRDVDALRFVAYVARTGLRPPRDRAA